MKILKTEQGDFINVSEFLTIYVDERGHEYSDPYLIYIQIPNFRIKFSYEKRVDRDAVIVRLHKFFEADDWTVFEIKDMDLI